MVTIFYIEIYRWLTSRPETLICVSEICSALHWAVFGRFEFLTLGQRGSGYIESPSYTMNSRKSIPQPHYVYQLGLVYCTTLYHGTILAYHPYAAFERNVCFQAVEVASASANPADDWIRFLE